MTYLRSNRLTDLEPGERAGVESLRALARWRQPLRAQEVDTYLVPRLIRAGHELGSIAKVVTLALARQHSSTTTSERDRTAALDALKRGLGRAILWHEEHGVFGAKPGIRPPIYEALCALREQLGEPTALTMPMPTTWNPPPRPGPTDTGWSEAEAELVKHNVSQDTRKLIRALFAL